MTTLQTTQETPNHTGEALEGLFNGLPIFVSPEAIQNLQSSAGQNQPIDAQKIAEALLGHMPEGLKKVYFTKPSNEPNEKAEKEDSLKEGVSTVYAKDPSSIIDRLKENVQPTKEKQDSNHQNVSKTKEHVWVKKEAFVATINNEEFYFDDFAQLMQFIQHEGRLLGKQNRIIKANIAFDLLDRNQFSVIEKLEELHIF